MVRQEGKGKEGSYRVDEKSQNEIKMFFRNCGLLLKKYISLQSFSRLFWSDFVINIDLVKKEDIMLS